MEAERKPEFADTVDNEADRIREIFKHSFPQSEADLKRLIPEDFTETVAQRAETARSGTEDEFDWSITLANVEAIVDASQASRALVLAAEKRAEIAEAKAREALHWLRMLHKAVQKGLPDKAV